MNFRPSSEEFGAQCDVFLNFRGEDVRRTFINTLACFLQDANVRFFLNDKTIRAGDEIGDRIVRAITDSRFYICVFSKNYASSSWCLRELAFMLESRREFEGKEILPIFYDVKVEDVKLETPLYLEQLEELKEKYAAKMEEWSQALKEITKIKGLNSIKYVGDADLSKSVVQEVKHRLKIRHMRGHLVGMRGKTEKAIVKLDLKSGGVKFLIIHGISGVGKTTLAKVLFDQLSVHFQGCSFLADIQESTKHPNGFKGLKEQLLRDIPDSDDESTSIKKRFRKKKVLIVLDDARRDQVMKFARNSLWFGPGSRIIITAPDPRILPIQLAATEAPRDCTVNEFKEVVTLEMKEMECEHTLKLFSRHAFRRDLPPDNFLGLADQAIESIGQPIPLTIEIIGSFLYQKSEGEWTETIRKLKAIPPRAVTQAVKQKLMVIYRELSDQAKKIFLDIACVFVNKEKTNAMYMWEASNGISDFEVLVEMSLVKVTDCGQLWMHDYLRNLGREIVRRESWNIHEGPSRLWEHDEALKVLNQYEGKQNVEALCLCYDESLRDHTLTRKELTGLQVLRFLKLFLVKLSGDLEYLLPRLRWLSWNHCPQEFSATNLLLKKLVILDLSMSLINDGWVGWRHLRDAVTLKVLDLSGCDQLEKLPDLSKYKYLERLVLEGCTRLVEIDSVEKAKRLKHVNLRGCDSLKGLPKNIGSLEALTEIIIVQGENKPFNLPESIGSSKSLLILEVGNVGISNLPVSQGGLGRLERLSLFRCTMIKELPDSFGCLRQLTELDISETGIITLPASIENLKELKVLKMERSSIRELPSAIGMVEKLEELHARDCRYMKGQVPEEMGSLSNLKILDLSNTGITSLPKSISQLSQLTTLHLESCDHLKELPKLPQGLTVLHFDCWSLLEVPDLSELGNLVDLVMSTEGDDLPAERHDVNFYFDWIQTLGKLENLELSVPDFTTSVPPICFPQLKSLSLSCKDLSKSCSKLPCSLSKLVLAHVDVHSKLPHSDNLENLSFLRLHKCSIIEEDGLGVGRWMSLFHFSAIECSFSLTNGLCLPQNLRVLRISECKFSRNPLLDLTGLKHLKHLELLECSGLVEVRGAGELESLQELIVQHCGSLSRLGDLSKLKKLEIFDILSCEVLTDVRGVDRISEACQFFRFIHKDVHEMNKGHDGSSWDHRNSDRLLTIKPFMTEEPLCISVANKAFEPKYV